MLQGEYDESGRLYERSLAVREKVRNNVLITLGCCYRDSVALQFQYSTSVHVQSCHPAYRISGQAPRGESIP